jgi:transglutaminase-like putative cysteine protease
MIYDVRQITTYRYASAVANARHILRLTPVDRNGQRVLASTLGIEPEPVERREGSDFFGNRISFIVLDRPHDTLTVRVAARVIIDGKTRINAAATPPWEEVRQAAYASADLSATSPAHFLFPSRQISLDPEIRDYAAASFPPDRPILAGALEFMHRIKSEFTYEVGATTVSTTPSMSFALRRGVCQDFSHIMISGMRSLGMPAAYMSGYLRTGGLPGGARLEGSDAMHAWILAWCGAQTGWVGLDPTNDMLAGTDHVPLAVGRDYADVAPIDGVVFGSGEQELKVAVQVTPVA